MKVVIDAAREANSAIEACEIVLKGFAETKHNCLQFGEGVCHEDAAALLINRLPDVLEELRKAKEKLKTLENKA